MAVAAASPAVALDRHPELKSRAVAWTEFDGSYVVNTGSRAEMQDFFWNVFARPYPASEWTGSLELQLPGSTSELFRAREFAQLNAYRALNGSPPMVEDESMIEFVQAGALLLALNVPGKPFGHATDPSWRGYNSTAAQALADSALNSFFECTDRPSLSGSSDCFIADNEQANADWVGHRTYLLHDNTTAGTLGAASHTDPWVENGNAVFSVWHAPLIFNDSITEHIVAYPAPGYMPIALFGPPNAANFRWSFVPARDFAAFRVASDAVNYVVLDGLGYRDAQVSARINGRTVPVNNLIRNNPPGPLTWDFGGLLDFEGGNVKDGTAVEITVSDVAELKADFSGMPTVVAYHTYRYTVTFFDENLVRPEVVSPKTSLINLSSRSTIGHGDQVMIAGFCVSGALPVRVALRTQGPGLTEFGVQHAARGPHLQVYDSDNRLLGENASWKTHPDWRLLESYGVAPRTDMEAGMVLTLWPGLYTAVVSDEAGGIGIVEVFNIDGQSPSPLINLSTRAFVGGDEDSLIAGFVVQHSRRRVVLRTQGPGLRKWGITGAATDTVISVRRQSDGQVVAENDDWQNDSRNAALGKELAPYAPTENREAALVLNLEPGAYTAVVATKGSSGVGMVEVFDVTGE